MEAKSRQTNDDVLLAPGCYWSTRGREGQTQEGTEGRWSAVFQQVILTMRVYKWFVVLRIKHQQSGLKAAESEDSNYFCYKITLPNA